MVKKIEYHQGDVLCEKTGVIYLEELAPRVKYYNGYKTEYRRVKARCSCGRVFEKELSDIKRGSLCQVCGVESHRKAMTKYPVGSTFGEYNTILLKRIDKQNKKIKCLFECGRCHETFEAVLSDFQKSKYQICHNCMFELTVEKRRKYNVGDIIENPAGFRFYFEKELSFQDSQLRRGIFYEVDKNNKQIGSRFTAIVYNVARGVADGSASRANKIFLDCLNQLPYIYKTEISFSDLLSDKGFPLRYDFGVYTHNGQLVLFELDGEQHYTVIDYFGGEDGYEQRKRNDELKNLYAKDHGYSLIRIPFTKFSSITPELIITLIEGGE